MMHVTPELMYCINAKAANCCGLVPCTSGLLRLYKAVNAPPRPTLEMEGVHAGVLSRTVGEVAFPCKNPQMPLEAVARRPFRAAEFSPGDKRQEANRDQQGRRHRTSTRVKRAHAPRLIALRGGRQERGNPKKRE